MDEMATALDDRFEQILHETQDVIRAYVAGLGVAPGEVDDIAQEVYVTYYRGMEKIPADVEPVRWLKGIAKRMCKNHFRRAKRNRARQFEMIAELLSQGDDAGEDETFFATAFDALARCMRSLTEKSRQLLALKYGENRDAPAIAAAVRMNPGAVRMTLLRIRETLRNCVMQNLGEEGMAHG